MTAPPPRSDIPGLADPLGLIAAAVPLGILAGTLIVTATVFAVTILREGIAATAPSPQLQSSPVLYVLLGGTFAGVVLAAATTWSALSPVENTYRRGMFATVSGFATVVVMLVATPVHALLGRPGLAGLAGLCLVGVIVLARRLRRIRAGR